MQYRRRGRGTRSWWQRRRRCGLACQVHIEEHEVAGSNPVLSPQPTSQGWGTASKKQWGVDVDPLPTSSAENGPMRIEKLEQVAALLVTAGLVAGNLLLFSPWRKGPDSREHP